MEKISDILDPLTHTPLIRTIQFGNKSNGPKANFRKPIGFKPAKAASAYKFARKMISTVLGREFVFYDGRKTQCNAVKNQLPKLGLKIDDATIAKYCTHNSVTTLNKHYITNRNDDRKFETTEAFSLLQCAAEKGFDENSTNSLFLQRKRQLECINEPERKRIRTSQRTLKFNNIYEPQKEDVTNNKFENTRSEIKQDDLEIQNEDLLLTQPEIMTQPRQTLTQSSLVEHGKNLTQNYITNNHQLTQININSPVPINQSIVTKPNRDPLQLLLQQNINLQNNFFMQQMNHQKMNAAFMEKQMIFQNEMMDIIKSRQRKFK